MAKNTTKIIAGALAVVGVYFIFKYFKKPKAQAAPTPTPDVTTGGGGQPKPINSGYPLKKGSKGTLVSSVQQWLLKIDKTLLPKYGADGDFGSETEAAVLKILGKKTIDSNSDIDTLILKANQKNFPYVAAPEKPVFSQNPPFWGGSYMGVK